MTPTASFFAGAAAMFGLALVITATIMVKCAQFERPIPTDPWALQRRLMVMSGQRTPALPRMNKTVLLYWALMQEEMSETAEALRDALNDAWGPNKDVSTTDGPGWLMRSFLIDHMERCLEDMRDGGNSLKDALGAMGDDWSFAMTDAIAMPLLDGTTDNAVVNAGFAIAAGLPGSAAYASVLTSNLSKANPDTGMIDKRPDGKWIKGRDFREPDLHAVLKAQRGEHEAGLWDGWSGTPHESPAA